MKSAVHYSQQTDSYKAGREAAAQVLTRLGRPAQLLILFSSIGHDLKKVIGGVKSLAEEIPLCGCTGAGIITGFGSDEATHSIALMAICGEDLTVTPFMFENLKDQPESVGGKVAERINENWQDSCSSHLVLLFAEGLSLNADRFYRGLHANLPNHVDVVGGTAGNDYHKKTTYQFCSGSLSSDAVCGVLLQGGFTYKIGVTHGSRPMGLFRTITRAKDNVIYEIDHIPALDILKQFIGDERVEDVGHILNLFELGEEFPGHGYSEDILNRAIVGVEERDGGIRLAVEIAEGTKVRITRRDMGLVLERTREMTRKLYEELGGWKDTTLFYFNCSGRGTYLFGDPEQDVNVIREMLTPDVPMIGFFTFGEFAPVNNQNYFHNYTGVLVGLEE